MRYISEQFKDIQREIMRPATMLHFEVNSDVAHSIRGDAEELDFDTTVAPIVAPEMCVNEHLYAVVGDEIAIDDPNRICAPDNSNGVFSEPKTTVPFGITAIVSANTEVLIGDASEFYNNFAGFASPVTLSFKGGVIPDYIRVERYDFDLSAWETEDEIDNSDLNEEVLFEPADYSQASDFRRFYVKNSTDSGRFQLNWIRGDYSLRIPAKPTVIFENEYISSININEETDLTSQSLPSYEMTVECLDVDEIYTPDSSYWTNQFAEDAPCYLKIGYEIGSSIEYIPFFFGKLTQAPSYEAGKITFKIAVDWRTEWTLNINSKPNSTLATGDIVDSVLFKDLLDNGYLFDSADVFHGEDDITGSECNYYGEIDTSEARQLVANALGCYITAGVNTYVLHNTNDIQYKPFDDYILRSEQVQNTLESKQKVGKIVVTRNENTLAAEYTDVASVDTDIPVEPGDYTSIIFKVPFFPIGKIQLITVPRVPSNAVITMDDTTCDEKVGEDGLIEVELLFTSNVSATIRPTVRFWQVNNVKYKETISNEEVEGEVYENNNDLVTNGYVAGKVKRVASLINDVPNQYEVDLIADYRYELGDVIRLETKNNNFKTCVITGLNFTLPGSNGHVTCRKIFSLDDTPYSVKGAEGLKITFGLNEVTILETPEDTCVVAHYSVPSIYTGYILVLGATSWEELHEGEPVANPLGILVTDNNNHVWSIAVTLAGHEDIPVTNAPVVELEIDPEVGIADYKYAAIKMIKTVYESQGMTAPVSWDNEVHWNWE